MKKLTAIIVFSLTLSAFAKTFKFEIYSPFSDQIRQVLRQSNIDHDHGSSQNIHIFSSSEIINLEKIVKFPFTLISKKSSSPYMELKAIDNQFTPSRNSAYFDHAETLQEMMRLESENKEFAKVYNLNEFLFLPKTVEGNSLYALQVSDNPGKINNRAKILFIGQHHARELMTHHAVLDIAKKLLEDIKRNAKVVEALASTSIWFVPVVNPDGLNHVFSHDSWWRKNRRKNNDGTYGVDLNRNYEFDWGACGSNSSRPSSNIYKGHHAHSEVETMVMHRLNDVLKAQYVISFHSSGDEVLFPYVCRSQLTDKIVYDQLRDGLVKTLGFGKRLASSSGEDFEHHFHHHGSLSFLIELGQSFQPDFSVYKRNVLPNVLKILPFLIKDSQQGFLEVQVIDKVTGDPIPGAQVTATDFPLVADEIRVTDRFGVLRRKFGNTDKINITVRKNDKSVQKEISTLKATNNTKVVIQL